MALKFGCDPEAKIMGIDANRIVTENLASAFGVDGYPRQFEVRPAPSGSTMGLLANLAATMKEAYEAIPFFRKCGEEYPLLAGHYKDRRALGGHLHVSGHKRCGNKELAEQVLMSPMMLLSDAIDDLKERELREAHRFGRMSPWREKAADWLEFRVPGSWLLSPATSFMNMWLFEAVCRAHEEREGMGDKLSQMCKKAPNPLDGVLELGEFLGKWTEGGRLFVKRAEKLFKQVPLDWGENLWPNWV